ncbi:hypothetical protein [Chromobacterium amazonense]|uniref:hypothetical protein n=1 Tax=Chromobacterium amazonense TaxID=1382803 RepID=UPI003F78C453
MKPERRLYLTAERYYLISVQFDLFGEAVIQKCWGSRFNQRGGGATEPYQPERLARLHRERLAHGYLYQNTEQQNGLDEEAAAGHAGTAGAAEGGAQGGTERTPPGGEAI